MQISVLLVVNDVGHDITIMMGRLGRPKLEKHAKVSRDVDGFRDPFVG